MEKFQRRVWEGEEPVAIPKGSAKSKASDGSASDGSFLQPEGAAAVQRSSSCWP